MYDNLIKERYIISKHTNTSYADTGDITPKERNMLINLIIKDLQTQKELIDNSRLNSN